MEYDVLRAIRKEFFRSVAGRAGIMEWDLCRLPVRLVMVTDTGTHGRLGLQRYVYQGWRAGGPPEGEDAIIVGYAWGAGEPAVDAAELLTFPNDFRGLRIYYAPHGEIVAA